jgi:DNA-binding response OmpR family regulator
VPSASLPPTGTTSQGSILLLEEYDALAAAISSALHKFAPHHVVHVASSLADAGALARKIDPALFVIDFDPPFPGLTVFLQEMRDLSPEAKALIIASKVPRKILSEARSVSALQFVGKPFDVPEFGAAVQALLGPWTEAETATPRASLQSLGLPEILLAECAGARTVALEIENGSGKSGEILVREGRLSHAETGKKKGADAFRQMAAWENIEVRELDEPRLPGRSIGEDWTGLLIEAFREIRANRPKPAEKIVPPTPRPKTGKKIVIVDDTEMLLIFVEDVLLTTDPELQITTALNAISGIKEIERVRPDLVLLDYSLPDLNGDEVCRRLLQNSATAEIPVLMMSGHVLEMAKAAATLDNVVATIAKPFLSDALVELVQQTLKEPPPLRRKPGSPRKPRRETPTAAKKPKPPPAGRVASEEPTIRAAAAHARAMEPPLKQTPSPAAAASTPPAPAPPVEPQPKIHGTQRIQPQQAEEDTLPLFPEQVPAGSVPLEAPPQPETEEPSPPPSQPSSWARLFKRPPKPVAKPPLPISPEQRVARVTPPQPVAPPPPQAPRPPSQPTMEPLRPFEPGLMSVPVLSTGGNDVVLGLFLDVLSVQLTPDFQMGSIRARPSSLEVSLHAASPAMRAALPERGFQLGPIGLDDHGRIVSLRLIPTGEPFRAAPTQNGFEIGGVSVVPVDSARRVQLTPAVDSRMTMHLLANLELAGVELSPTFQVSQLLLKNRSSIVRVTLNPQAAGQEMVGTRCEALAVSLNHLAQITELVLNPVP